MKTRIRIISALLLAAVMLLMASCSPAELSTQDDAENGLPATQNESVSNDENPKETEEEKNDPIPLSCGDVIDNENFRMTFDSLEIADEYSYRTSEYSSTSIYVEEGYKALIAKGLFENKSMSAISTSDFVFTACVNDSFKVDGFSVRFSFERSRSHEIDPYTEFNYILYINIPEKLAEKFETATFTLGFNNDMSTPSTIRSSDGTTSLGADNLYAFTSTIGAAEAAAPEAEVAQIKIGETIVTDDYEFTLSNVELTYEILPRDTSSVYSSYPADSGKVYINVVAQLKNTMKRDIRIEETFSVKATYADGYKYDGFVVADDGNRFDWVGSYVAATPLETAKMHGIIECPAEVEQSAEKLEVLITLSNGDEYLYVIR